MDCIICLDQEVIAKDNALLCEDCHHDNYLFDTCTECDCRCTTDCGYKHIESGEFFCEDCAIQKFHDDFLELAGEYHAGHHIDWKYYNKALEVHKSKPKPKPAIKTTLSDVAETLARMVA